MKTVVVGENQSGLLFKNGKYKKTVDAGKYRLFGGRTMDVYKQGELVESGRLSLDNLLADAKFAARFASFEVGDEQIVLHFVNGSFKRALWRPGKYAVRIGGDRHEFRVVDIKSPEVAPDFPRYLFAKLPNCLYTEVRVAEYQRGRLYFDKKFVRLLGPGVHYFWHTGVKVECGFADTRLLQMDITGQEIMTQDKVALRINFVCSYRLADYVKVLTEVDNYAEQLHVAAQLALRDFVGKYKLDEILENKEGLSRFVFERLREKGRELFVEVTEAGVKDIILPGEIREIMNTVLVAEKRAQANVIARREEVASTRSLLNTAKLMEENRTLYKLKELEYVERICENVGNITLSGSGDLLAQLAGILGTKQTETEKAVKPSV